MTKLVVVATAAACVVCLHTSEVLAQEPPTPGGNVTAEEAAVLPPVVVTSPNEPIARHTARRRQISTAKTKATGTANQTTTDAEGADLNVNGSDLADYGSAEGSGGPAIGTGVFSLGQLDMIGGSTVTNEAMWTFNKKSLSQAVNILPGVSFTNSGGARNEGDILVRGFNRLEVPLSIDGVRVYLPADNRIDMNRFLTDDLAEVQVAKGYVSVLNGPGAMGGAINLVSRKPTKEIELEGRAGIVVNGDIDDLNSWNSYAYAGTRQKGWYAQVSANIVEQDHFNLSHDFTPFNTSSASFLPGFPYQGSGNRDRSDFQDWRINTKVGITPNATDEYTINYTHQEGNKGAPLHVDRQIVQGYFNGSNIRYWDWPQWNTSSLSWLSKTKLGDSSYIKTNTYYNTFDNIISFYPNGTYTHQDTDSAYNDHSVGGFVEMGTDLIPMNTLKGAIHYREDVHTEQDTDYTYAPFASANGPKSTESEQTWSFAVENTFHATRNLDIVGGLSYDMNEVLKADPGLDKPYADAWNWQTAAIYSYSETGKVHADVSSRTRFPTLFDRYSTRFGSKMQDPDIGPERATNYEIGISDIFFRNVHVSSALFYSNIDDSIQNAFTAANGKSSIVGFNANGYNYGFELSADWDVSPTVRIGGNYTYLERHLNFGQAAEALSDASAGQQAAIAASQIEGSPRNKAFIYLAWRASDKLTFTPSVELATDRKALVTGCSSTLVTTSGGATTSGNCNKTGGYTGKPNYVDIGAYALVNFQAEYAFNPNTSMTIGGINLLDENYSFAEGFPEPGRQFFANLRARF
jgi:iron complex outermembrane receptor protein